MPPRKKKEVVETLEPVKQFEINWDKIAEDVRAAADLVKNYPQDDGPLTNSQIRQIKKTAPKPSRKK